MLLPGVHALIDVRVLRLLRVFRIFKLTAYMSEFQSLGAALLASRRKIAVFLMVVVLVVVIMGTLMYVVEGPENGYTSIPVAVYWAITTRTCHECLTEGHLPEAVFCYHCGARLPPWRHSRSIPV
jgi:voltage-gated potassium channel